MRVLLAVSVASAAFVACSSSSDSASTITCATAGTNASTPSSTHYVITFCPDGEDGI